MNILPKKRWHVRTKENIARVRRDEAQAAEEEKEKERRIKLAEKEARRDLMRIRARSKYGTHEVNEEEASEEDQKRSEIKAVGHINFFEDEEAGLASSTAVNQEHEEEKKQEKEKYEKQIGYLTYLGQDTNEATGNVSWYNKCPQRDEQGVGPIEETGLKHKVISDPLMSFKKFCSGTVQKTSTLSSPSTSKPSTSEIKTSSSRRKRQRSLTPERRSSIKSHKQNKKKRKKHKKDKKHKSHNSSRSSCNKDSDVTSGSEDSTGDFSDDEEVKKLKLEKLRAERLRREKEEKKKADKLMAKISGVAYVDEDDKPPPKPIMKQRYNSQFNPDIAKQNYEDQKYRF